MSTNTAEEKTSSDSIYAYNEAQITQMRKDRPWERESVRYRAYKSYSIQSSYHHKHFVLKSTAL